MLLKRQPDRRPATLRGYKRHRILKRVYPALTPSGPSDEVRGWVRLQQISLNARMLVAQLVKLPRETVSCGLIADAGTLILQVMSGLNGREMHILDGPSLVQCKHALPSALFMSFAAILCSRSTHELRLICGATRCRI